MQANTNTSGITKPAVRKRSERWGTPITFAKEAEHTYTLKDEKGGIVSLREQGSSMAIGATQAVSAVVVVARRTGYTGSVESNPIEFTKQAGNTLRFVNIDVPVEYGKSGNTYTQAATNDRVVAGDNRVVVYSISPTGEGASVDPLSGKVDFTLGAIGKMFIITATLQANAKYTQSTVSYNLEVQAPPLTKPVFTSAVANTRIPITFPNIAGHSYALKHASGLDISDVVGDPTKKQVRSTEVISGVIVVATKDGKFINSDPIDFLFHVANKAELKAEIEKAIKAHGNNVDLNYIDTSSVTDMSELFQYKTTFNGDISKWNTSSVEDMSWMFNGATAFNQSLNSWDVSSVEEMQGMFSFANSFNQPLNTWQVANVNNMNSMFSSATSFNQDLSGWIAKYMRRDTSYMFQSAKVMEKAKKPSWASR